LGARAGEVLAENAPADVDLGGLRAVTAGDQFGGVPGVVVVGGFAERVDPGGAFVGVAGPASGLAGDVGVAEADDGGRAFAGAFGAGAAGVDAGQQRGQRERGGEHRSGGAQPDGTAV